MTDGWYPCVTPAYLTLRLVKYAELLSRNEELYKDQLLNYILTGQTANNISVSNRSSSTVHWQNNMLKVSDWSNLTFNSVNIHISTFNFVS